MLGQYIMEIQRNPGRPLFWLVFVQTIKCHTNFLGKMPWESKCTGVSNKFTSLIWDCGSVPSRWLHCHHKDQAPPWSCSPKRLDLENISQQFHNFQKLCRLPVCQTKQEYCDCCSCLYVRILLCTVYLYKLFHTTTEYNANDKLWVAGCFCSFSSCKTLEDGRRIWMKKGHSLSFCHTVSIFFLKCIIKQMASKKDVKTMKKK